MITCILADYFNLLLGIICGTYRLGAGFSITIGSVRYNASVGSQGTSVQYNCSKGSSLTHASRIRFFLVEEVCEIDRLNVREAVLIELTRTELDLNVFMSLFVVYVLPLGDY